MHNEQPVRWMLRLEHGQLCLRVEGEPLEALEASAFYKMELRRYVERTGEGRLLFRKSLTYLQLRRIIHLCENGAWRAGAALTVDEGLTAFIEEKELHIQKRARLGLEIKRQDPKLQTRFEQYKEVVDRRMVRKLRDKQMWDSFFMCTMKRSSNFSVPGSGKTASVLGMYAYLKAIGLVRRLVVICPKNAFGSWIDEFWLCFGEKEPLRLFNLHAPGFKGRGDRRQALRLDSGNCNLLLFNYESLKTYREDIAALIDAETMLVFDEVHKVKRLGGEQAENALEIARAAIYAVAMTGTPIPNTYLDLYNLLHIIYPDEYETYFGFSTQTLRSPSALDTQHINERMMSFFCRTDKRQLQVPDANADRVQEVAATEAESRLFSILMKKYRRNKLTLFLRVLQLESDPRMLLETLDLREFRYILDDEAEDVRGIDYADYEEDVRGLIASIDRTSKAEACLELIKRLTKEGKPVVVWCVFVDSIRHLARALEAMGISAKCVYGEVALEDRVQILEDFKQGRFRVLLTNPHTLAESVSLHSVCHDAIYFEYSYNLVHLLQSKDRIHRLGLPQGQYTQYHFLQNVFQTPQGIYSMDAQVYARLKEKEQCMLRAIDHQVLETLPSSEEDLEMIFSALAL